MRVEAVAHSTTRHARQHADREPGAEPGEESAARDDHLSPPDAFLIAARIRVYVPHRQMLPAIE